MIQDHSDHSAPKERSLVHRISYHDSRHEILQSACQRNAQALNLKTKMAKHEPTKHFVYTAESLSKIIEEIILLRKALNIT